MPPRRCCPARWSRRRWSRASATACWSCAGRWPRRRAERRRMSRRLLVVPIVHTEAELGSEGGANRAAFIARHGDRRWAEREALIGHYWQAVHDALLELPIEFE